MRVIAIDFEFFNTSEQDYTVVCCATKENNREPLVWWFAPDNKNNENGIIAFLMYVASNSKAIWISYSATAEIRSLMSLIHQNTDRVNAGIDLRTMRWVDLLTEWRMLRNSNNKFFRLFHGKAPESILNAKAGLIGKKDDIEEKERMQKLILSCDKDDPRYLWDYLGDKGIREYCAGDVADLHSMFDTIVDYNKEKDENQLTVQRMIERGRYQVAISEMESRGHDIEWEWMYERQYLRDQELRQLQEKYWKQCPSLFALKRKKDKDNPCVPLTFKQGALKAECEVIHRGGMEWSHNKPTDKMESEGMTQGSISTATEMLEYALACGVVSPIIKTALEYKKQLNVSRYFATDSKTRPWFEYCGSDRVMRPRLNAFGSQTGRNYPGAKGFFPAQGEEIRKRLVIPADKVLVGLDYGQQEFAIEAVMSGDTAMIEDYVSGDPYIALAQRTGGWDGKKETRQYYKAAVLGLGYGLGVSAFVWRLRFALARDISYEDARYLYDAFWESYPVFRQWREEVWLAYQAERRLTLPGDGWTMWGHNPHKLSVCNYPVQGTGGAILRKACINAMEYGLALAWPVHDSIYIWVDKVEDVAERVEVLVDAMLSAWYSVLPEAKFDVKIDGVVYGLEADRQEEKCIVPLKHKDSYQ